MQQKNLTWNDVDKLMEKLLPQLSGSYFDAMIMITRGGIVPGGIIAEAMNMRVVLTASVDFPSDVVAARLMAWPEFLQFPEERLLRNQRILVVDDVWGSGRTITAVKGRVVAAGGLPELCVLHYNPHRTLFTKALPTYYAEFTQHHIVYPWEIDRGSPDGVATLAPVAN